LDEISYLQQALAAPAGCSSARHATGVARRQRRPTTLSQSAAGHETPAEGLRGRRGGGGLQVTKLKADAAARHGEVKAHINRRGRELDAKMSETDADWAEADAASAIDDAAWTVENAKHAVLSAIDARANPDGRTAIAKG
jgi:hypothetical protein